MRIAHSVTQFTSSQLTLLFILFVYLLSSVLPYSSQRTSHSYMMYLVRFFLLDRLYLYKNQNIVCILLTYAGFVKCHCTGRWEALDSTNGKDSGAFHVWLLYSHYHDPDFYYLFTLNFKDKHFQVVYLQLSCYITCKKLLFGKHLSRARNLVTFSSSPALVCK